MIRAWEVLTERMRLAFFASFHGFYLEWHSFGKNHLEHRGWHFENISKMR
jgi:hypothetical protein